MDKSLDLIVFGATGFTGRLVAEYLNTTYGVGGAGWGHAPPFAAGRWWSGTPPYRSSVV